MPIFCSSKNRPATRDGSQRGQCLAEAQVLRLAPIHTGALVAKRESPLRRPIYEGPRYARPRSMKDNVRGTRLHVRKPNMIVLKRAQVRPYFTPAISPQVSLLAFSASSSPEASELLQPFSQLAKLFR